MLVEGVGEMRRRSMKDNRSVAGATWGKVIIIIAATRNNIGVEVHYGSVWFRRLSFIQYGSGTLAKRVLGNFLRAEERSHRQF